MRRFSVAIAAATLIASTVQGGMPAARAGGGATAYYLALGDSLAAGYQPGRPGIHKGYVDDLWRSARQQIPGLGLRDIGCRGETSPFPDHRRAHGVPLRDRVAARRGGRLP